MRTFSPPIIALLTAIAALSGCGDSGVQNSSPAPGTAYHSQGTGGASGSGTGGATASTGGTVAAGNTGNTPAGTVPVDSAGTCSGYATRFWDCCKPHCGWNGNVPGGVAPMRTCSKSDAPLSSPETTSSCDGGDAHTCQGMAPWAVSENLSYGFAATQSGDVCGRCYQLDFTGTGHNGSNPGVGALAGKTMIVQTINVGFDVGGGQFDIMIPGGGVGAFNACSSQWGVSTEELGAQYGGFMSACEQQLGYSAAPEAYKSCVSAKCTSVFGARGLSDLEAGCQWYVEWFGAADNPNLNYKEVSCPAELTNLSGMSRGSLNDISTACR